MTTTPAPRSCVGTLAHNALRDGDWTCRGLEHELSALDTKITHGAGLAVIFPAWMRYVWREHPERFLEFSARPLASNPSIRTRTSSMWR